ncbi:TetR/AcrR family transcriptional regulator [Streptomyces sp. TP-A0874]|uniref:TetR/AcrR family transcriptional regulator n=1 Tax=Streptomyces sp. TP-A0874 TaxID=549819 RepID=UPI00085344D6|nr:TetR family transcriptional regulator C-terminal domain-containing protein [Streptomyces sp. TP-A0874]
MARPRRHDPDRRQRIVDAAVRVVERGGIAGLSHRSVAAEADVPLGSTTYHFTTLDDLLAAALTQVIDEQWLEQLERWERGIDPALPLADEIVRFIEEHMAGDRTRVGLEYELYLAALRYEAVRPIAADCLDRTAAVLRRRTADEATARTLVALIDGLMLQLLLTGRPFDPASARQVISQVIDAPGSPGRVRSG